MVNILPRKHYDGHLGYLKKTGKATLITKKKHQVTTPPPYSLFFNIISIPSIIQLHAIALTFPIMSLLWRISKTKTNGESQYLWERHSLPVPLQFSSQSNFVQFILLTELFFTYSFKAENKIYTPHIRQIKWV